MTFRRNADEPARRRQRSMSADPSMANRVVVDKLRAGRAGEITLGELASATDADLVSTIPEPLVRGAVRSLLAHRKGFFYGGPVHHGMVDALLEGPPRVATPDVIKELLVLQERNEVIVDFMAPLWLNLKLSTFSVRPNGDPVVGVLQPYGWLGEELRATLGDEHHPVVILVESAGDAGRALQGSWVCFMGLELEE